MANAIFSQGDDALTTVHRTAERHSRKSNAWHRAGVPKLFESAV
jgi:hypothetical protein